MKRTVVINPPKNRNAQQMNKAIHKVQGRKLNRQDFKSDQNPKFSNAAKNNKK